MSGIHPETEEDEDGMLWHDDEYDALNDETFGNDIEQFDWEADHNEFARLIEFEKSKTDDILDFIDDSEWDRKKTGGEDKYNYFSGKIENNVEDDFDPEKDFVPLPGLFNVPWICSPEKNIFEVGESELPDTLSDNNIWKPEVNDIWLPGPSTKIPPNIWESETATPHKDELVIELPPGSRDIWLNDNGNDKKSVNKTAEMEYIIEKSKNIDIRGANKNEFVPSNENTTILFGNNFQSGHDEENDQDFKRKITNHHSLSFEEIFFQAQQKNDEVLRSTKDQIKEDLQFVESVENLQKSETAERNKLYLMFPPSQIYHTIGKERLKEIQTSAEEGFATNDNYAGLMTVREKYWLAGIQLLPVNGIDSYKDDYYFTMNEVRHHMTRKNQLTKELSSRKPTTTTETILKNYTPLKFENSLGKVPQGSSYIAPRKLIDTEPPPALGQQPTGNSIGRNQLENQKSTSQQSLSWKTYLLNIETVYAMLLEHEDKKYHEMIKNNSKNRTTSKTGCELEEDSGEEDKIFITKILEMLTSSKKDFVIYMSIRKGRQLVLRFLSYCENPVKIWNRLFESIEVIINRDVRDGMILLSYLPHLRIWLESSNLNTLLKIAECFTYSLKPILHEKFGVSILSNMIERAEYVFENSEIQDQTLWLNFIGFLAQKLYPFNNVQRPVVYIPESVLQKHLSRCTKLKNVYKTKLYKLFTNTTMAMRR